MLPSAKGHSSTLLLSQFTYSFYLRSKHLCKLCALILTCLPIALVILLCVDNYPWDKYVEVESNRWNLIFLCVASMPLLWTYCFMSNSYASLIDACLESIIHEKSLLYDSVVYSLYSSLLRIAAFISYALQ